MSVGDIHPCLQYWKSHLRRFKSYLFSAGFSTSPRLAIQQGEMPSYWNRLLTCAAQSFYYFYREMSLLGKDRLFFFQVCFSQYSFKVF